MGLALVNRIVQRFGGRIQIDSEVDVGTTVRFDLEACTAPDCAVAPAGAT